MDSTALLHFASSDVLATLFETLPIGVVAVDAEGRVVVFNQHEERLAGRTRERVLGRRFFEEIAPCMNVRELGGRFRERVRTADLDEVIEFSFPFPTVTQPRDVLVRLRSFIADGAPYGLLLIEDVSMRRSVDRLKQNLADLLVHDMKSPLTSILGNLEFVQDRLGPSGDSDLVESLRDGVAEAQRLNRMLVDLLDIARLETGTFPLEREEVDVAGLVADTVRRNQVVATMRDVTVVADTEAVTASIDPRAFRRILDNLLSNAIRHTRRGSRVTARGRGEGAELVIEIVDEGEGIPPEVREQIFDKFVQVRGPVARANHGLGLTFVRLAARAHGGDVCVDAGDGGRGSCFQIRVPREVSARE